ncbi:hypothetical protein A3D00_00780 [Candidatus Woesebacteria bacterium RIFCSPHIGHO2_02_FULL_38_9]|uniref:PIN domain-containing protein n=1 Tax=Candidatus Woesebacteria bacterium RIFCSPHIGHO2_01_FULL_39_28 TaxID=1802496 RepID=A0A1F7YDG4_9BACT|nr:MAG: hypothetical protein A2627_03470 [Candidatus Woesebacteria bacterium RIFCSPHIGHO2_01_FULL_39_28]OGM32254.1 MAG: hypothetical protein A3D00_00780 [Candidatus Woesebacteria bacterium RIFCSPHIGHO2_02_FULL_38_9]OGM57497.1 MAG: hypothetical protein A3A50_00280 [Candidatus Woesebacteria bacterium RIFCSPLOWO2_01_FULL_38_20]
MKFLLDSDFLIALYKPDDSNHKKSKELFKKIQGDELAALNIVFQESTTVVSKKMGMTHAKKFYDSINRIIEIKINMNEELEQQSWRMFLKQTKKGTSFVDCANLATTKIYGIDKIASFDKFYPKEQLT